MLYIQGLPIYDLHGMNRMEVHVGTYLSGFKLTCKVEISDRPLS
jgi:hypothetical protein